MQGIRPDGNYKRSAIIGTNLTGKSKFIYEEAVKIYDFNVHKFLIISESQSDVYKGITRLKSYDELKAFKSGIAIFYDTEISPYEMFDKILAIIQEGEDNGKKYLQNGGIFFDDCSNYMTNADANKKSVKTFLGSHRHRHIDLYFAAHTFTDFPSFLRRRMMYITICKTLEHFDSAKEFSKLRYPNPYVLYHYWIQVMNDQNNFKKVTIKTGM